MNTPRLTKETEQLAEARRVTCEELAEAAESFTALLNEKGDTAVLFALLASSENQEVASDVCERAIAYFGSKLGTDLMLLSNLLRGVITVDFPADGPPTTSISKAARNDAGLQQAMAMLDYGGT